VLASWDFNDVAFLTGVLKVEVDPRLSRSAITVPVRIAIKDFWIEPPRIWVIENLPWLKAGDADWHVYADKMICYELHDRWICHLTRLMNSGGQDLSAIAAQWLIRSAAHVLHVHYTCHRLGIDQWPEEEAPTWPHGQPAAELYHREVQRYTQPRNDRAIPRRKRKATIDRRT